MASFRLDVIEAAKREREVKLTTYGRKSGKPYDVIIWITTDGTHLYIRSGQGLGRQLPQNLIAPGGGGVRLEKAAAKFKPRLVPDPEQARAVSRMYTKKYGTFVVASKPDEALTPGENATFAVIPA